ncbi:MAG TPA: DUF5683 domain-containing protein [Candidatus Cloacimonas sp.]|nr:hypothetical protein [Candidatus Cloacimonas sp.]MDD2250058.1 DUF5683 domain-containing protein [Candidatus Cloacimonadota bacterium]MCK9158015.1 DUF5683 domain-containing protein [Candidatus Cloacimonas sp.]MCK9164598.1 DUF5683 domain-containing protein [Candidatus Cloacimonas sp.]MDD3734415.1 DUF5683 domain-containing protein [Candidatus Cloacimonadota bacterium]
MKRRILALITLTISGCLLAQPVNKDPTKAVIYSLFPGGGQIYNEAYIKAGAVIGFQSYLLATAIHNNDKVNDYKDKISITTDPILIESYKSKQKNYKEKRTRDIWLMGLTMAFSTLDAYIDAHLSNFNSDKEKVHLRFEKDILLLEYEF